MHVRAAAIALGFGLAIGASDAGAQVLAANGTLSPDSAKSTERARPTFRTPRPPLLVKNLNTNSEALIALYGNDGKLDDSALGAFRKTAGDEEPAPLKSRLIQLVFKAAYDLGATKVHIVSSFRPKDRRGRGGYHTTGDAVDFQLPGVNSRKLASYLRTLPRVGVGIYTHPKTQYVHLDVREQSFHWLDASPPGRTWKEAQLRDPGREARDAAYRPEDDLPKG